MRVQTLTGYPHFQIQRILPTIHGITGDRTRQGSHVHPDLMGAAGFQAKFKESKPLDKPFQNPPIGHGLPAIFPNRHFFPMDRVAADGQINSAGLQGRLAIHKGLIYLFHLTPLELGSQCLVGKITFCNHHDAGGIFIKAMDDTRAQLPIDPGQPAAMVEKPMHQGGRTVASGWMHHNAGRFSQNNEIIIFIQSIKGDRFGDQLGRGLRRDCDREPVPGLEKILGFPGSLVHQNHFGPDKLLNPRTRQPFMVELACQIQIKTLPSPLNDKKAILVHRLTGKGKNDVLFRWGGKRINAPKKTPVLPKIAQAKTHQKISLKNTIGQPNQDQEKICSIFFSTWVSVSLNSLAKAISFTRRLLAVSIILRSPKERSLSTRKRKRSRSTEAIS